MLDVAVIGAGPAGLSATAALLRCTRNPTGVQVFDHIKGFGACGAGLGLRLNGYAALDAIDRNLSQKIASLTYSVTEHAMHSLDGKVISSFSVPNVEGHEASLDKTPLGWSELRNALADHIPATNIQLGKRLLSLQQHKDFVTVHFTDGSSVDAKVVVGADGSFSKVRQQTMNDGMPDYTGTTVWRARLLATPNVPKGSHFLTGGKLLATFYPIGTQDQLVWTVCASEAHLAAAGIKPIHSHLKRDESKENQLPEEDGNSSQMHGQDKAVDGKAADLSAGERCKRVWGDHARLITDLIEATDEGTILEHNLYARQPDSLSGGYWGQGRVTLVGDAAHCMRPGSGQGVNQAFEDAVVLAHAIRDGGLTEASLRAFEAERIPHVQEIMATEMVMGLKSYTDCPAEMPDRLRHFKHAAAWWAGTDGGNYEKWVLDRTFKALTPQTCP